MNLFVDLYVFCSEFIHPLETSRKFLKDIQSHMADDGILVASIGFGPSSNTPAVAVNIAKDFRGALVEAGFASVRDYEEVCAIGNHGAKQNVFCVRVSMLR